MKLRWISGTAEADNTFVLLGKYGSNILPEWRVVGYVMLRQVYDRIPAKWYAFGVDVDYGATYDLGSRESLTDAKVAVARAAERLTGA